MAVPNTNTFTLQDVVDEINPTTDDLQDCFNDANPLYKDIRYAYYYTVLTSLYGFRNYNGTSILAFISVEAGSNSGEIVVTVTHNFEPTYISKDNGATWQEASYAGTTATYTYTGCAAGSYYIKAKDYKQEIAWANNPFILYGDWWLPSRDEMDAMYNNLYLYSVGNFYTGSYWTSSEWDADYAWYFAMDMGAAYHDATKDETLIYRPSRKFIDVNGLYALRDVGPAGGWIYYIYDLGDGNSIYYEASIENFTSHAWSNIIDTEVTGTSTVIGSGFSNSTIITGQVGHTDSAAKHCLDLIGN